MKLRKTILPLLIFLLGCGDDSADLVQRITSIEAFDVGNEGNSSDLRVRFELDAIANINELRIIIIPSSASSNFTKKDALKLSSDRYHSVDIDTSDPEFSERLPVYQDVNGNPIQNNIEYVIRILMIGNRFNQLSILASNKITLKEQGVYVGYYEGIWTNESGSGSSNSFTFSATLVGNGNSIQGNYNTSLKSDLIDDPRFPMGSVGEAIISVVQENKIELEFVGTAGGNPFDTGGQPAIQCENLNIGGDGIITSDLVLVVENMVNDCHIPGGPVEIRVSIVLTRQIQQQD